MAEDGKWGEWVFVLIGLGWIVCAYLLPLAGLIWLAGWLFGKGMGAAG